MSDNSPWQWLREQMPITDRWAYFDHAAIAPLSAPARAAMIEWADDLAINGTVNWPRWRKRVEAARELAASMIGAQTSEVAVIRNTTEGINLLAEGFPWQPGDNIVTLRSEFPSNRFPWLNLADRGVEVRFVEAESEQVDAAQIAAACNDRTRIVAVSWVGYATGWRHDVAALAEVAHRRGALLFLDAIQGLGVFPLDVSKVPVDCLAADGHKWLLGPEGAGVFYLREEHLDRIRPLGVGWNSVVHAADFQSQSFELKPSAGRYEGGSYNMPGIAALAASLELLSSTSPAEIGPRILELTDILCEEIAGAGGRILSDRTGDRRSGIVTFELRGQSPPEVRKRCLAQDVVVSCRGGGVRVSPHLYCSEEDRSRLLSALRG